MDKKTYLFTLTISPVQSFIGQARQTKDLFVGSKILSNLIQKALETFTKEEIIFPQKSKFVSNKFLVKLEDKTEDEIKKLGEELEKGINHAFINLIFKETNQCDNNLQNFFTVFWVAVPLDENNYQKSYKQLEQNLGAVKNLRTFSQEAQLKDYPKCSLCGERNVAQKVTKDDNKKDDNKLCLVCLTKRKCEIKDSDNSSFPSLAKICLLDWLKDVNYDTLKNMNHFDEEWFLEEDKKDEVTQFIKKNKLDISKQKKYYALLHFDIDDMGKKLSSLSEKGQRELSNLLGEFAGKAKEIVDKQGRTIYAGGDDFLGFVNLAYLFDVTREIDEVFGEAKASLPYALTFSTSIIIAHYKAPLHKVLDFSRTLLEESKNHFEDKNGMGVIVLNNSAINAKTICRYGDFKLLEKMKNEEVGFNLHYKLQTTFSFIESQKSMNRDDYDSLIVMIEYEIKRLLQRENGEFNKALYGELISFLHTQVSGLKTNDKIKINFENFIAYLKTLEQLKKVM